MEDTFRQLKKDGQNTLDNVIRWFKEAHIIDGAKDSEEKARRMFEDVADETKIEWEEVKRNLHKLADEGRNKIEDLTNRLATEGPKLLEALKANVHAFADNLKK